MPNGTISYNDDQGAMQILNDITNLFLNPIIKPDLLPPELIDIKTLHDIIENYPALLRQNVPMTVTVALGSLFALIR